MKPFGWAMTAVGEVLTQRPLKLTEPAPDQVRVRVAGCGICHTDLGYLFEGVPLRSELPRVLGHEIAGVVETAGSDYKGLEGKAVVVPAVIPCGKCGACQSGRSSICPQQIFPGNDIDGGFASHVTVPGHGLCEIGEGCEDIASLSVIADAVTTPFQAVVRSGLSSGDVAIFVGAGGVGAFGVQIAAALGAHVIAIDVDGERLALAEQHGAARTFNARELDARGLKKSVRSLAKSEGWPGAQWKIFETSGTSAGQETAFNLLGYGATLMVVGYSTEKVSVRLSNLMAFDAQAIGVWGCPPELYPKALEMIRNGSVVLEPFIEKRPMSSINEVLSDVHARRTKKRVVLLPES